MSKKVKRQEPRERTAEEALSSLMNLCARAERSSGDAMRLMHRWGVDQDERQGVLDKLIEEKFIDDRRYADAYVREKINLSDWGRRKIAEVLYSKGISREIMDESLLQLNDEMAKERVRKIVKERIPRTKAKNSYDLKGKLMRYGLGRGYEYDDVMSAVESLVKEEY